MQLIVFMVHILISTYVSECQISAFEGSTATFKGSSNVSYSTDLLTFVTIDVNTCIYRLQHAYKLCNFYIKTLRCSYKFNAIGPQKITKIHHFSA